jgi:transketolase
MNTKIKNSKKRCSLFRKRLLQISQNVQALHVGGSFSCVEVVDSIYNILKKKNDKFILSKGHCGIIQYIVLEYLGIIPKRTLDGYCQPKGRLGVHPEVFTKGIEASTGSLGHGLAIGAGMAIANKNNIIYIVMSDGELMEGSTWESALIISSLKLSNIILIIDNNDLQSATRATNTHPTLYPIKNKFKSFGWDSENCNGHNSDEIVHKIKNRNNKKPFALISRTTKGYPISFMKNVPMWHYRAPNKGEYLKSLNELKKYEK